MQFSAIILTLAAASQAAAIAIPGNQGLAARQTSCAEVTRKLEACTDACGRSDWRCTVDCSLAAAGEYASCTGDRE